MLSALNIKGAHITVDAMNTQKTITDKITKSGADYTMRVKENHKTLTETETLYYIMLISPCDFTSLIPGIH